MTFQIIFLFSLIAVSGLIGGIVNYFMIADSSEKLLKEKKDGQHAPTMRFVFWRCVIVGLGASILVPLFLQMISSNLVQDVLNGSVDKIFVFVGFCVVASIFSRRFIISIGEKLLKELEETKQTAEKAKEIAENSDNKADAAVDAMSETEVAGSLEKEITAEKETPFEELDSSSIVAQEYAVLSALTKANFTLRTLSGIAKDANMSKTLASLHLEELHGKGYVRKITRHDKSVRYSLSDRGRQYLANRGMIN